MKPICVALGIAAMCAVGVAAQEQTIHEKGERKVEVKDGRKVTVAGCLERNPTGGYILTNDEGALKYALVTNTDLSGEIGHRVAVRGKATDRGDAKVTIESKVGTTGTTEEEEKTELKGNAGLKYLGVDSVKSLSKSCL